jgi:predicted MFS family arabinose efflux permease
VAALFLGRVLSGLSAGVFTGTATAAIIDLAREDRRARAGLIAAAVNMLGLGLKVELLAAVKGGTRCVGWREWLCCPVARHC